MAVERTYIGDDERHYPDLRLTVVPGQVHEFESADDVPDDDRWATAAEAKKAGVKPKPAPEPIEAPEAPADSEES